MQHLNHIVTQRLTIIEKWKTVTKGQIGEPARVQQSVVKGAIERDGTIDVQRAVVGAQRRGLQQRRDEDQADHDQRQMNNDQ